MSLASESKPALAAAFANLARNRRMGSGWEMKYPVAVPMANASTSLPVECEVQADMTKCCVTFVAYYGYIGL